MYCTLTIQYFLCFAANNRSRNEGTVLQAPVHTASPQSVHQTRSWCSQNAKRATRFSLWCPSFPFYQWHLRWRREVQTEIHPGFRIISYGSDRQKRLSLQGAHQTTVSRLSMCQCITKHVHNVTLYCWHVSVDICHRICITVCIFWWYVN